MFHHEIVLAWNSLDRLGWLQTHIPGCVSHYESIFLWPRDVSTCLKTTAVKNTNCFCRRHKIDPQHPYDNERLRVTAVSVVFILSSDL